MESVVGKRELFSIVYYGYRIFLCLVSSYYNTVNTALLFQIKNNTKWTQYLVSVYAIVDKKTGRYGF